MQKFTNEHGGIKTPIRPREALQGGRVNAIKLYYEAPEGEHIAYLDVTSLYPYVNMYCDFPVGPPEIIKSKFKNISTYFGLCKLKILPPRQLFLPVLGMKTSTGRLVFTLW